MRLKGMDNSREIASFRRRANKVSVFKRPPTLEVAVWHQGEESPEEKPWQLRIMIEEKVPY